MKHASIQIHGHRGCRGLYPENTIQAFVHAVNSGVDAIELDVVINGDGDVLVSHEPWFSHEYCLDDSGQEIKADDEKSFNIYRMTYEKIKLFDCGTKKHLRFPKQIKIPAYKPLLFDVINELEKLARPVFYNIEIKSDRDLYNIFQPEPEVFVETVMAVIKQKKIEQNCLLQSFDPEILIQINKDYPEMKCSLLVENNADPINDLENLGFIPFGYNPFYKLVNPELIQFCKNKNMQVLVWTVNDLNDMLRMVEFGVDGIITDYPDQAISLLR